MSSSIHFIGIGGIGISALAFLSLAEGKKVTGSDQADSPLIDILREAGAVVDIGHAVHHVNEDTGLVVYTEAIDKETNPEYKRAVELKLPLLSYFQALGQISATKKTVAVVGTHGKTTTTAMLGLALIRAGLEPTVIVGSKVAEFGGRNIYIGKGDALVAEGCEYRRSFLSLEPFGVVLLNCEMDHLDYYRDEEDYVNAYRELVGKIPTDGFLVANMDIPNVQKVTNMCAGRLIPIREKDVEEAGLTMKVAGDFNRWNAVHALKAAEAMGGDPALIRPALEDFRGTWRRMERKGQFKGATVIDDYGHHPTEIRLTLKAIRENHPKKRLICVFQPHQYSRTRLLIDEFATAFNYADKVIIPNIYAARDSEVDKREMSVQKLVETIGHFHSDIMWGENLGKTFDILDKLATPDDVIVVMGAGDITTLAERLTNSPSA